MIRDSEPASNPQPAGIEPRRLADDLHTLIAEIAEGTGNFRERSSPVRGGEAWEESFHGPRPSNDVIRSQIVSEQAAVDEKLGASEPVFVITASGSNRVHLPACFHVQHVLNRAEAWEQVLNAGEILTPNHLSMVSAPPRILTRAEVEGLNSYVACQACAPTLNHQKKRWLLNANPMRATNLEVKHIGRDVTSSDGEFLGQLVSHQRIVTAHGVQSITMTTKGMFEGDGTERYVIRPKANV
jgi:hypothetical protein